MSQPRTPRKTAAATSTASSSQAREPSPNGVRWAGSIAGDRPGALALKTPGRGRLSTPQTPGSYGGLVYAQTR